MAPPPAADGQALEKRISNWAITVVIIIVLTPWAEQAQGIAAVMA